MRIDADVRERPEPRGDAVDDSPDATARSITARAAATRSRARGERDVLPRRDRGHVASVSVPDRDRHGSEGYYRGPADRLTRRA